MDESQKEALFICRQNIGRSQVAMALYNQLGVGVAESAGFDVDKPGEKLKDNPLAPVVISVMQEKGVDISEYRRRQLDESALSRYGFVAVIAELRTVPIRIVQYPNVMVHPIPDLKNLTPDEARPVIDGIEEFVSDLVNKRENGA